jgi:secreted PhoX family phosphatase
MKIWFLMLISLLCLTQSVRADDVSFTATPAPATRAEMMSTYTRSERLLSAGDAIRRQPLSYEVLYRSGDRIGDWQAGAIVDRSGALLTRAPADSEGSPATGPFFANGPDANTLIERGDQLFLVTHFEYHPDAPRDPAASDTAGKALELHNRLPMAMNLARLEQNPDSGALHSMALDNIDMSAVAGLWTPCGGELTPWGTHLGGEEYEPDAQAFEHAPLTTMNLYLGTPGKTAAAGGADPYRYGYVTEVDVKQNGDTSVVKHFALGRQSNELAHIMPDGRTVYKGDDGSDVVLIMFIADRANDLSSGTLYAARLTQHRETDGGEFSIDWIRLGHARAAQIETLVTRGISFSDIFSAIDADTYRAKPNDFADYRPVYVFSGSGLDPDAKKTATLQYLKLQPGMEQAAAFLETRRYAAYLGATSEFTKMEGVTSNTADRQLYLAMSYVQKGMLAADNGDRPQDHIHLSGAPEDLDCGLVYTAQLGDGRKDLSGTPIASTWVATRMRALITGARKPATQTDRGRYDTCDTDRLANPDNLKYSDTLRTLFIGEDSSHHLNNFLWAYRPDTSTLTRILSASAGGEITGLQIVEKLRGHAYIMANVQHPGAAKDLKAYRKSIPDLDDFRAGIDQRGTVGYIGGMPAAR